ncbi:MAG: Gfo/Idh/MocA family oxidoreductase [Chloroflexi bacterium]|nr:Gfo/Idh/MocA family oxidoreductase [Chloroflexota bacterium]
MLRVGVIGVGNMGLNHARVYSQLDDVKLCGVADFDAGRAASVAARFKANAYSDYHALLEREKLDAVTVATPTREHLRVALDVIERGVPVLVEKPLAADVAQARQIVDAAERANVLLAVGHIERFNPAVQELKRLVDQGALGEISSVIAKRVGVMPPQVKDANVIIDLAVHDIDILNYFFAEMPAAVFATAGHALLAERYDHAEIFLRYKNAGCFVQVNWITPLKIRTLSVTGEAGHAELNYVTQKLELYETTLAREYDTFGDFVIRFGEAHRTTLPIDTREPLRAELENFISAIRTRAAPTVTGEDGVKALRVAEQVLEHLKNG